MTISNMQITTDYTDRNNNVMRSGSCEIDGKTFLFQMENDRVYYIRRMVAGTAKRVAHERMVSDAQFANIAPAIRRMAMRKIGNSSPRRASNTAAVNTPPFMAEGSTSSHVMRIFGAVLIFVTLMAAIFSVSQ